MLAPMKTPSHRGNEKRTEKKRKDYPYLPEHQNQQKQNLGRKRKEMASRKRDSIRGGFLLWVRAGKEKSERKKKTEGRLRCLSWAGGYFLRK